MLRLSKPHPHPRPTTDGGSIQDLEDLLDQDLILSAGHHDLYKSPQLFAPSPTTVARQQRYRILGTLSLVGLTYVISCGGPVGSEPLVAAGGPLLALVGIGLYVLLCQIPFAFLVAELSSAFPENGGFVVWVLNAFGPFWGFQVGYWSTIADALNNALLPGLILSTLTANYEIEITSKLSEYLLKVAIALALALPTFIGVRFVAFGAVTFLALILLIVGIFSTWGLVEGHGSWSRLGDIRGATITGRSDLNQTMTSGAGSGIGNDDSTLGGAIDWVLLINSLFWNFDGIYGASVIGGEVQNPARTYIRVIVIVTVLTILTFTLPIVTSVVADEFPWLAYSEDAYPQIAEAIGGKFLNQLVLLGSVVSSMAMFTCSLFFQSFQLCGMAEVRLLPGAFRRRHERFHTPYVAVLPSLLTTLVLVSLDFESIMSMTNAFSAATELLIVLAMLQLRRAFPYLPRPTKVPGNVMVLALLFVPSTCVFGFMLLTTMAEPVNALIVVLLLVPGVLYALWLRAHGRGGGGPTYDNDPSSGGDDPDIVFLPSTPAAATSKSGGIC